ncbi:MAG: transposase, partial [bacterium]
MINVGKSLFLHGRGHQEIIRNLADQNVSISDSEVTYLGKKFVIYLAIAHAQSSDQLKVAMIKRGGYILHLDGTCEGDSPHLCVGMDGLAEIVLGNIKLPSEKANQLIPFLRKIKEQYGNPIAIVSDMGKGIASAVEEVFPNVQVFICHSHFLRDLGKDLMEDDYSKIRNKLKTHKIRTNLRNMKKQLEIRIDGKEELVDEVFDSIVKENIESKCLEMVPTFIAYGLIRWISQPKKVQGYG